MSSSEPWFYLPKQNIKQKNVVIIGGGLAGTSLAYSFAKRKWQVTLIERNSTLAGEASGNKTGIITPVISHKNDVIGEFFLSGFFRTIKHLKDLNIPWQQCGAIDISKNKLNKLIEESLISSLNINKVSSRDIESICGKKLPSDGIYMPDCGIIKPADLCSANVKAGGEYIKTLFNKNILKIKKYDDVWSVSDENGELAKSDVVVIANGNDAKNFEQSSWLPLTPVAGQVTYLQNSSLNLKTIICYDGGYATPTTDGFACVGATFRRDSDSIETIQEDHQENLKNLQANIKIDEIGEVSGRAAIRATTPDRRPVIGMLPDYSAFKQDYADLKHGRQKQYDKGKYLSGLCISTGHGSRGLTSCPIAGEIIAAMVSNEALPLSKKIINALNPARFIIRDIKRSL